MKRMATPEEIARYKELLDLIAHMNNTTDYLIAYLKKELENG